MPIQTAQILYVPDSHPVNLGALNGYESGTVVFRTDGPLHFGGSALVSASGAYRGALLPGGTTYRFELEGDEELYAIAPASGLVSVESLTVLDESAPVVDLGLEIGQAHRTMIALPSEWGESAWLEDSKGNELDLTTIPDDQFKQGIDGRFGNPVSHQIDTVPGEDGGRYRYTVTTLGTLTLPLLVVGESPDELRRKLSALRRGLNVKRGPQTLHVVTVDAIHRTIRVIFESGFETDPATNGEEYETLVSITFRALDPFWSDTVAVDKPISKQREAARFFPVSFPVHIGASSVYAAWTEQNPGDVEVIPTLYVTGPADGFLWSNPDTGEAMRVATKIALGQTVILDGINLTVTDQRGNDLFPTVEGDFWELGLDDTRVVAQLFNMGDGASVRVAYLPKVPWNLMTSGFRIYPRNAQLQRVGGPLTDFQSLTGDITWTPGGSWAFSMPANDIKAHYFYAKRAGVLIHLDGEYFTSGPVESITDDDSDGVERIVVSGPSDSLWLARRRAEPCHSIEGSDVIAYLWSLLDARSSELTAEIAGFDGEVAQVASLTSVVNGAQASVTAVDDYLNSLDFEDPQRPSLEAQRDFFQAQLSHFQDQLNDAESLVSTHADQLSADQAELAGIPQQKVAVQDRINAETDATGRERYYLTAAYDKFEGRGEEALKHYVINNLGTGATLERQMPLLDVADDHGFGSDVAVNARFDQLADLLPSIALAGGDLGFGIFQKGQRLEFDVKAPLDASRSMRFSKKWGTLQSRKFQHGGPDTDETLIAGQGEGTARQFVRASKADLVDEWGLIEGELHDRRDTDDVPTLISAAADDLGKAQPTNAITLTSGETAGRGFRRPWDVGYVVTVEVGATTFVEMIRSVKFTCDSQHHKPVFEPVIAPPGAVDPNVLTIFRDQQRLASRQNRLERI